MLKKFFLLFVAGLFLTASFINPSAITAQPAASTDMVQNGSILPRVFLLGDFDGTPFEQLKSNYENTLFSACHNDAETAYFCWMHLLKHLESFAQQRNYDINGVKMWLYVFWNKDGTVAHIAYYLKPNSKFVKTDVLTNLLKSFSETYKLPLTSDKNYSNYNSAAFPVNVEKPAEK